MSDQAIDLALAFVQSQPASAAAVLEQLPPERVGAFLGDIPRDHAAAVLNKMLPRYIAGVCGRLEPAAAASLLSQLDADLVAAILRHSEAALAGAVLERLPETTRMACKMLLAYGEEQVGAWMVANIMTLPTDCTAREARARLAAQHLQDSTGVLVIDRDRKLHGRVGVSQLLAADPDTPVRSMATTDLQAISGRTTLASAADHAAWDLGDTAAVINRHQQLVGILRHSDLRRGLRGVSKTIGRPTGGDPLAEFLDAYGSSLLALFGTLFDFARTKDLRGERR